MVSCTNCKYKWSFKEVMALGFSKEGKDCSHCHVKQYLSAKTQNILTLGYISLLFVLIFPFFIKLSDKKENLL
ncbi:hypothetical protein [Solibacillus sp. FSL K6-1523]|uniref:hypothetical protein n=1 Tax=Solibacillus sp. FSL K6-1523 TaxID=2921471 RepID=UPI0030F72C24